MTQPNMTTSRFNLQRFIVPQQPLYALCRPNSWVAASGHTGYGLYSLKSKGWATAQWRSVTRSSHATKRSAILQRPCEERG